MLVICARFGYYLCFDHLSRKMFLPFHSIFYSSVPNSRIYLTILIENKKFLYYKSSLLQSISQICCLYRKKHLLKFSFVWAVFRSWMTAFPLFPHCTTFLQTSQARKIEIIWTLQRRPDFSDDKMCARAKKSLCSAFFSDQLWSLHMFKPESSKGHRVEEQREKEETFKYNILKTFFLLQRQRFEGFYPNQLTIFYESILWHLLYDTVQRCIDVSNPDVKYQITKLL